MKKMTAVFGGESVLGLNSGVSLFTLKNVQRAVTDLEDGVCNFGYIILDHLDSKRKIAADKYLSKRVEGFDSKIYSRIYISASSHPYIEMLAKYVRSIPGEICIKVLAKDEERNQIEQAVKASLDTWMVSHGKDELLLFVRGRAV